MRARVMLLAAVVGTALLVSCGGRSGKVVAKVGEKKITIEQFNQQFLGISPRFRPKQMYTMEGKRRFLEDLINKEIMVDEAEKRGYPETPGMITTMKYLTDQEVLTVMREEAVDANISLAPGEVRELYEKLKTEYHVFLLIYPNRDQAVEARARIMQGTSFGDLAGQSSIAEMYPDGDADWVAWHFFEEPLNSAVLTLEPGQVTEVIPLRADNWAVAKLEETRPKTDLPPFEEFKPSLGENLRKVKKREAFYVWMEESEEEYQVQVNEDVAEKLRSRLEWNMDPGTEDTRPEFSMEEESLVLGSFRGGEWLIKDFLDRMMITPRPARPDREMSSKEFVTLMKGVLANEALLADAYSRGFDKLPRVRAKLDRDREERIVNMLHSSVIGQVTVTDEDVESYYEQFTESFREPEQYALSRIVVESKADAESMLRKIRAGESFEDLAKKWSRDERSGPGGGKMSPVTVDVLPPAIKELAISLRKGKVGGPVKTEEGWQVIQLDEHTLERQLSLDEVRERIHTQLLQARQAEMFEEWLNRKREDLGVEIYEDVLAEIELAPEGPAAQSSGESPPA